MEAAKNTKFKNAKIFAFPTILFFTDEKLSIFQINT